MWCVVCGVWSQWWVRLYYSHNILTPHSIRGHAGYGPAECPLTLTTNLSLSLSLAAQQSPTLQTAPVSVSLRAGGEPTICGKTSTLYRHQSICVNLFHCADTNGNRRYLFLEYFHTKILSWFITRKQDFFSISQNLPQGNIVTRVLKVSSFKLCDPYRSPGNLTGQKRSR